MSPHDSGKDPAPAVKGMDNILAVTTTAVSKMQQEIATLRARVAELETELADVVVDGLTARVLLRKERLRELVVGLLSVLESDWIRGCESISRAHGRKLDEETAKGFHKITAEARRVRGEVE